MSGKAATAAAAPEGGDAKANGGERPGYKRIPKPDQAKFDAQIAVKEGQITALEAQLADVERKIAAKIEGSKGQRVRKICVAGPSRWSPPLDLPIPTSGRLAVADAATALEPVAASLRRMGIIIVL